MNYLNLIKPFKISWRRREVGNTCRVEVYEIIKIIKTYDPNLKSFIYMMMMAYERSESVQDNFGKFIHQF